MDPKTNFDIKYLSFDSNNDYLVDMWPTSRPAFPKKTFIISLLLLLFSVSSFYAMNNKDKFLGENDIKLAVFDKKEDEPTPTVSPKDEGPLYGVVLKNDSYWKIAKRYCGNGRAYLTIKPANGGKALQPGDTVLIAC